MLIHCTQFSADYFLFRMGVEELSTNDKSSNDIAVSYLGISLIIVIVGMIIIGLALIGYNTYISFSRGKIEVQATNSDSID